MVRFLKKKIDLGGNCFEKKKKLDLFLKISKIFKIF